jgi:hypothetical protein
MEFELERQRMRQREAPPQFSRLCKRGQVGPSIAQLWKIIALVERYFEIHAVARDPSLSILAHLLLKYVEKCEDSLYLLSASGYLI